MKTTTVDVLVGVPAEDLCSAFFEDVCPEPRKRRRKIKVKMKTPERRGKVKQYKCETRGAYLMRVLGLSTEPRNVEHKSVYAAVIAPETKYKINEICDFKRKDFIIEEALHYGHKCYAVRHTTWHTQIYGGESYKDAEKLIVKYIEEHRKPIINRSTDFIHLIQDSEEN